MALKLGLQDVTLYIGETLIDKIYEGEAEVYSGDTPTPAHDYMKDYFTIVAQDNVTVHFTQSPVSGSTDSGSTWTALSGQVSLAAGDKMWLKSIWSNNTLNTEHGMGALEVSGGDYTVEGNILSLVYDDDFYNASLSGGNISNFAFKYMFWSQTGLTNAENLILPSSVCPIDGYHQMFVGCSNLTTAPVISATTVAGWGMQHMFKDCSSLTTAPALPATTIGESCYKGMFVNCTSLTTAPELPATTLANNCYEGMFYRCISLTTAPVLSAATLVNYSYWYMFEDCTNLNSITCLATDISATDCTTNWLKNVAASGTFTKDASMSNWTTGVNGIPNNWTVQDY